MKEWFIKRGYPEAVVEKKSKRFAFLIKVKKSIKVEKGVKFVVTYHSLLNKLTYVIRRNITCLI